MLSTDWYSPEELADMLGVPVATVYQWRHKGTGPAGTGSANTCDTAPTMLPRGSSSTPMT